MKPIDKANDIIDRFRMVLMNENTECGNEILCTIIAKQNALICVDEILRASPTKSPVSDSDFIAHFKALKFWQEVKYEIEKI